MQVLDLNQLCPKPQGMILTSCDNDRDPECYGFDPVYYLGMTMPYKLLYCEPKEYSQ